MPASGGESAADLAPLIGQAELLRELRTRDAIAPLAWFLRPLWPVVEPATLEWGPHMQAVCDALQEVAEGKIKRLVINIPPGFSKSLLTSVFFPAWQWLHRPSARNLFLSHDADLATRDSRRMRILITSPEYRDLLMRVQGGRAWSLSADQNQKVNFENTARGFRYCGSITSGITGKRGDGILIDDPHDAKDATVGTPEQIRARMEEVETIFRQTIQSRLNDPRAGYIVVIMQRLHTAGLAAYCLKDGYASLILPMRFDPARRDPRDWRTEPGELLDKTRFPEPEVAKIEAILGRQASGQLDQRPTPDSGGLFKREWFQRRFNAPPIGVQVALSVDATFRDSAASDFVAIQVWGHVSGDPRRFLLDQRRARMAYTATRQMLVDMAARWKPYAILIEAKANGDALIDDLRRNLPGVIGFEPGARSKYERAQVGSAPAAEAGQIWLPEGADFADIFIEEHATFPLGTHDDCVDACSQYCLWVDGRNLGGIDAVRARIAAIRGGR